MFVYQRVQKNAHQTAQLVEGEVLLCEGIEHLRRVQDHITRHRILLELGARHVDKGGGLGTPRKSSPNKCCEAWHTRTQVAVNHMCIYIYCNKYSRFYQYILNTVVTESSICPVTVCQIV